MIKVELIATANKIIGFITELNDLIFLKNKKCIIINQIFICMTAATHKHRLRRH